MVICSPAEILLGACISGWLHRNTSADPVLSDEHEEIIIFYKEEIGRDSKMNFFSHTSDKEEEHKNSNMIN